MKKLIAFILPFLCFFSALPAFGECENLPIADNAAFLTEEENKELSEKIDAIRTEFGFDVAVYTESALEGEAEARADDIFDYGGYGDGEGADGILLYISADPRSYYFTTHGSGLYAFNDDGLIYLEDEILPYLKDNDYYSAIERYAECAGELLTLYSEGTPYTADYISEEDERTYTVIVIAAAALIPLLIAFIAMKIKSSKMHTARHNDYAANYEKPGSMKLSQSHDIFLYSTTQRTKKVKVEAQPGTSHTSSSGQSHGGRGGSY